MADPPAIPAEIEPLAPGIVRGLHDPQAYPHDATAREGLRTLQTHISHLFLSGARVYKLRKAVAFGFLDFATRQARNADCLREVAVNRRLAPDVYLGVAPVHVLEEGPHVGPPSDAVERPDLEHCVVMRRLPEGRDALSLLAGSTFRDRHVDSIAEALVRFHRSVSLGRPAPFAAGAWLTAISSPIEDTFPILEGMFEDERVGRLAAMTRGFLRAHADRFEMRRCRGRVVDGHGDIHLGDVWFERDDSEPLFIDAVEFSERLRHIDVASELAFLAMDLACRSQVHFSERLLRRYAAAAGDFHLYTVVDYFMSYRAAVRAKVAVLAAASPEIRDVRRRAEQEAASRYLDLALACLASRGRGGLVAVTGRVGAGKSMAADVAVETLVTAATVSSDRVRKVLAGLAPSDRVAGEQAASLYGKAFTRRVYAGLLERAQAIVVSGRFAVLDATFSQSAQRSAAAEFARAHGVPFVLVELQCREATALERLAARERNGRDPSDAGAAFYPTSAARFEPIDPATVDGAHIVIDTDSEQWRNALADRLRTWQAARPNHS